MSASEAGPPSEDILAEIEAAEQRLRHAALHGNVAALDRILADDLIYVDQNGQFLSKQDDIDLHRTGALKLTRLVFSDIRLRAISEDAGLAVVRVDVRGHAAGVAFSATMRYSRVWRRIAGDWRVVSTQSTFIA
ncbi:nuclear transport factor 2 family protein [Ancylobacter sp. MQZ15Z-1]|uniref:Nuclear transport factor 2 family protein n=1 Tax=Ancylobacter mangrovi TaxID=2972472 RepID=A0A9X2T3I7_9HYPH|nr:nuclear transport factor 2 family protein [Ancylobacter mangrovi]MCS0497390.1 nuclear transport factor 2 family protein [Ancylobacter mangrovi]